MVKTQVSGSCLVSEGTGAPFRILHVTGSAPSVIFREVIQPCVGDDASSTNRISGITVNFLDDSTARIQWEQPSTSGAQTRYDVIDLDREQEVYLGVSEPSFTIANIVPGFIYTRRIVPINSDGEVLSQGTPIALMVNAPSGAFRGRATRDDLEALKISLAGNNVRDCGEFTVPFDNDDIASEVSDCVNQALEEGIAFTADIIIPGEAFSYESLVGDNEGGSWLFTQGNSDVSLANVFTQSIVFGGYLTGKLCLLPAVSLDTNSGVFVCEGAF